MPGFERWVAKKTLIKELIEGKWDDETRAITSPWGENINRARVCGTVVSSFMSEDGRFASITLDDGTSTIRSKCWDSTGILKDIGIGDIVDVIGKVRVWEGETHIALESVIKAEPNFELMRKAELMSRLSKARSQGIMPQTKENLKDLCLKLLGESKNGLTFQELVEKTQTKEEQLDPIVTELLDEGLCYEPSPGKIKKI